MNEMSELLGSEEDCWHVCQSWGPEYLRFCPFEWVVGSEQCEGDWRPGFGHPVSLAI